MVQIVYEVRQSGFQHGGLQEEHKTFKKPELQSAYDLSDLSTLWKKKSLNLISLTFLLNSVPVRHKSNYIN